MKKQLNSKGQELLENIAETVAEIAKMEAELEVENK